MTSEHFTLLLITMAVIAAIVIIALYFVDAGYGMFLSKRWGKAIPNRVAWICMEAPVFIIMLIQWSLSDRCLEVVPFTIFLLFEAHYFQRAFVFPFLMKGKGRMPLAIMFMGIVFNLINGYIQGEWLFNQAPAGFYTPEWLLDPRFVSGVIVFFAGMAINLHSDHIIRHLRKPGDTRHYLPDKGMFKYVTSANYLGELVEWIGFAILTWSTSGLLFAWWTFANLVPRSHAIHNRYKEMFGGELGNRKRIIPFIY